MNLQDIFCRKCDLSAAKFVLIYEKTFRKEAAQTPKKDGDTMTEQEFSRLAGLYRLSVYRAAYCYTKNSADAEDITQEAFLKLFTSEIGFETDEKAKAWLIRTAINRCKDFRKSLRFRFTVQEEEAAEAACTDKRTEDSLLPIVMRLKPKSRCVLYMYYYEEYSVKEIAELLGEKKTTVTTRLMRARKQLKELLLKEGYYEL